MNTNDSILNQINSKVFIAPKSVTDKSYFTPEQYQKLYLESIADPNTFWMEQANNFLHWYEKPTKALVWEYPNYTWFEDGKTNIVHNCLDRYIQSNQGHKIAYIYTNELGHEEKISYKELYHKVNQMANALRRKRVKTGDTITIYMPLTINQITAMLACAKIGAVHSVVYAGFSAQALKMRIEEAKSKIVICSSYGLRRGKKIPLLEVVEEACKELEFVEHIVVDYRDGTKSIQPKQIDMEEFMNAELTESETSVLPSESPLFILYTSGTTGKPKGIVHTHAGYNLYTHITTKYAFNLHQDDLFWCTADTGWITGHSYIVYGPLSNGATTFIFEGAPDHPHPGIWWELIQKYQINILYTAPTAIRMFMKLGKQFPEQFDLSSLRILGSVGEPINPEAWEWYFDNIGSQNVSVVDTWWQTETGGHILLTLPSVNQKPGKAGLPFFGLELDVVDKEGKSVPPNTVGNLIIKKPWPSALRTCWNAPERFNQYWNEMEGVYLAGDLATKDEDGYFMILGRSDDVLNVSGHRIGTAEVESALVGHYAVAEAAVVGKAHDVKGQSIKAFIILKNGNEDSFELQSSIKEEVKKQLGSIGVPDEIEIVSSLPKTRSGKIMRRILKAKENGLDLGDTSTLED